MTGGWSAEAPLSLPLLVSSTDRPNEYICRFGMMTARRAWVFLHRRRGCRTAGWSPPTRSRRLCEFRESLSRTNPRFGARSIMRTGGIERLLALAFALRQEPRPAMRRPWRRRIAFRVSCRRLSTGGVEGANGSTGPILAIATIDRPRPGRSLGAVPCMSWRADASQSISDPWQRLSIASVKPCARLSKGLDFAGHFWYILDPDHSRLRE